MEKREDKKRGEEERGEREREGCRRGEENV